MRYVYPIGGDWTYLAGMPRVKRWRLMNYAMWMQYGRRRVNG